MRSKILHDYSRFTVLTIDTFFQRILRAFIKELGIDLNYNVEIETASVLTKSADTLIEQITTDRDLQRWLTDFVQERIDEGKQMGHPRRHPHAGRRAVQGEEQGRTLGGRARARNWRVSWREATAHAAATKKRMQDAAAEAVRIIAGRRRLGRRLSRTRGSRLRGLFLRRRRAASFERYGSRAEAACTRDEAWGKPRHRTAQGLRPRAATPAARNVRPLR